MVPGFTSQGTVIYNRNRETAVEFLRQQRLPGAPGRLRRCASAQLRRDLPRLQRRRPFRALEPDGIADYAVGRDDRNPIHRKRRRTSAPVCGVAELSRDFDWIRVRGTALYAVRRPRSVRRQGHRLRRDPRESADSPAPTPVSGSARRCRSSAAAASRSPGRNGVLAGLRSSKDQGQSNFTNPGAAAGRHRRRLRRDRRECASSATSTSSGSRTPRVLSVLRNQGHSIADLGTDVSAAVRTGRCSRRTSCSTPRPRC